MKVCWLCPFLWNVERVSSGFTKQVRKRAVFICLWQAQHSCFFCCQVVLSWLNKACLLFYQNSLILGSCCFPPGILLIAQATGIPWPRNEAQKILCQELFVFLGKVLALSNSSAIIYVIPQPEVLYKLVTFIIPLWVMLKGRINYCLKKQPH